MLPVTSFWSNSPMTIRVSTILHGTALLGFILWPEFWLWLVTVIVLNHLVLFFVVLFPRSSLLGANLTRLPATAVQRREIALTFDDGPDPQITPRILEILARYNARASFFCVGERAAANPTLIREIIQQGHSVENHSYHHANYFAFLGWQQCQHEVQTTQQALTLYSGKAPQFFRAPMGFRSPILHFILKGMNLHYTSWTRRGFDTTSRNPQRILKRLLHELSAGDILLLHDGIVWPRNKSPQLTLQLLPQLLQHLQDADYRVVSLPMAHSHVTVNETATPSITQEDIILDNKYLPPGQLDAIE